MADWRYIKPKMWSDTYFFELTSEEKLLFIYLFSNEHTNQAGIYALPTKLISVETNLSEEKVEGILTKFEKNHKIERENGIIWIKNFLKHQPNNSSKVWKRILEDAKNIPEGKLKIGYIEFLKIENRVSEVEDRVLFKGKEIKEKKNKEYICEVFSYWQEKLNHPNALFTPDRERLIGTRLNEGYTVEQCKMAIDGCRSSPHHMGENDKGKVYDSIKLIFRSGDDLERFISYGQKKEEKKKGRVL